jgi:hypothetical protein
MSKTTLQLRRGSSADNATFTGAVGEVIVNTTTNSLVVHDGTTVGGFGQAPLASPALTGIPTAPTAVANTNTTQIATTAFVATAVANASPTLTTTAVTEGANLYFTNARARSAVSATGSIAYNSSTGVFSYSAPTVLSAFTNDVGFLTSATILNAISVTSTPSGALSYNSANGVFTFTQAVNSVNGLTGTIVLTTTNIAEGTNKYATTSNVQTALAGGGVTNSMLANSTITVNGSTLTLGGSSTITAAAGTLTGSTLNSSVTGSNLTSVGTLTSLAVAAGAGTSANIGAISVGTNGFLDTGVLANFVSSTNSYNQVTVQNTSAGASASSEFIAYNNQGTASANFATVGINSSGYSGVGSINAPGYGYFLSGSTDLVVGTIGNNAIHFAVNSGATDAMTISTASNVGVGVNPTYKLDVAGDINFTGALRTSGTPGTSGFVLLSKGAGQNPQWSNIRDSLPNITQLDSWSATINGGTTVFTPTNNGSAVSISYPIQVLMFKNGVYQQPWLNNSRPVWNTFTKYGDYTVTAGQVVFTSPPQYGDFISATVMVGNVSNPVYGSYPFSAFDIATGT